MDYYLENDIKLYFDFVCVRLKNIEKELGVIKRFVDMCMFIWKIGNFS